MNTAGGSREYLRGFRLSLTVEGLAARTIPPTPTKIRVLNSYLLGSLFAAVSSPPRPWQRWALSEVRQSGYCGQRLLACQTWR